ncbi:MAG: class I SAM-dependent methyltransferase [Rhodomicrobium sp.]
MSVKAARLFARLQDADFYSGLHLAAANLLPNGKLGQSWLDVGCGPGLLTRIAAEKGHAACGIDRDPDMIAAARHLASRRGCGASFAVSDIETARAAAGRFDVVSASSLLVVLPNPAETLRQLVDLTKPEGRLLIVEASSRMSRARAAWLWLRGRLGRCG